MLSDSLCEAAVLPPTANAIRVSQFRKRLHITNHSFYQIDSNQASTSLFLFSTLLSDFDSQEGE